ncbi:MAG: glycosyltransferase family 4 protein [Syntrophales bacterium]|nr:glycosyltransferase family 4 protein [Syntrophales bacterium]
MESSKVRIGFCIPKYGMIGGAEGFAASLADELASDPMWEIHIFANQWQPSKAPVIFHRIPIPIFPRFLRPLSFALFAHRACVRAKIDIIHAHDRMFEPDIYTLHGIPHLLWIKEVRRKIQPSLFDLTLGWVEKRMVNSKRNCHFIAVSNLTKEYLLRRYPSASPHVSVVHPGIDPEEVTGPGSKNLRDHTRKKYGIPSDLPIVLFVSMNFHIKGLDFLINALGKLRVLFPEVKFHLVVVGRDNKGPYQRMATNAGIGSSVTFTGILTRKALNELYSSADLFVMPSRFDTFGIVVLEAMAKGLPVILSSKVGAKDLIEENVNGFTIDDPADSARFAYLIKHTLQPVIKLHLSQGAIKTAGAFTWKRTAQKMTEIYRIVLSKKHGKLY